MLIECLIQRDGPTEVHFGGFRYTFMSRPDLTGGDLKTKVCEMQQEEAWSYLLTTGQYRVYEQQKKQIAQPAPEPMPEPQYSQSRDITTDDEKALRTMRGILEEMGGMKKTQFLILCKTKISLSENKLRKLFDAGQNFLWKIEKLGKNNAKLVTPLRFLGFANSFCQPSKPEAPQA